MMTEIKERRSPQKKPLSTEWDPWDPWYIRNRTGRHQLTSVEFTVTQLCNLRCEHCAVGEMLVTEEGVPLPVDQLIRRLDEVETLQTLSITGGEPVLNPRVVKRTIQPLLRYAKERGIYTQINSNLTLPLSRYEDWVEDVDVLHISYNYRDAKDFHRIAFEKYGRDVTPSVAEKLFDQMVDNAKALSRKGVFLSAETLLSPFTVSHVADMHRDVAAMGCQRHEVHPLYQSDFAQGMGIVSLDQYRKTIHHLLDNREEGVWILFGTLPFYPCSEQEPDRDLWLRLHQEQNVTVRQDPDGRNRLNINAFTGDVIVTDFGDVPPLGNVLSDRLDDIFNRWLKHPLVHQYHCFCPEARCTGPNILVAEMYYPEADFQSRNALVSVQPEE